MDKLPRVDSFKEGLQKLKVDVEVFCDKLTDTVCVVGEA